MVCFLTRICCGKKLFPPLIRWAGYSLANHFLHLVCSVHFNSCVLWVGSWAFLLVLLSVVLWDFARGLVYLVVGGGRHVGPLAGLDLIWVALATAVRCRWGVLVLVVVLNCTRTRGGMLATQRNSTVAKTAFGNPARLLKSLKLQGLWPEQLLLLQPEALF